MLRIGGILFMAIFISEALGHSFLALYVFESSVVTLYIIFFGYVLLVEQSVKVGDYVTIAGQWAQIKSLGPRATIVQTFDRSEIIVPNSDMIANPVTNWTLTDRRMRIVIPVGAAYGSDVEVVLQTLMDCAMASAKVSRRPEPLVMFKKFGDSALEFELHVWIHDINERHKVRSALHQDLERRLRDAGITIAFPQRDIHIQSDSKKL